MKTEPLQELVTGLDLQTDLWWLAMILSGFLATFLAAQFVDADTIVFKDGRMRSAACDRFGYTDAPYKATARTDGIAFEAETESIKYGRLVWRGVVRDGKLDATATMLRQGKPPVENWVVAASKP